MLTLTLIGLSGGLIVTGGVIMIVSPLWISEWNRRNLDRAWGPNNFISKSLDRDRLKGTLWVYRVVGAGAVVIGLGWIAAPVGVMLGVLRQSP